MRKENWKVVGLTDKEAKARRKLRKKYNSDIDDFDRMLAEQNHRCKICGEQLIKGRQCHLDHNHRTGKVRGILCRTCNLGVGMFKDSPGLLKKAIIYLGNDQD
jgi:CRISPR/Cas system-associated protein Cas10 (large subunit of type III CRISPR-Cas system)